MKEKSRMVGWSLQEEAARRQVRSQEKISGIGLGVSRDVRSVHSDCHLDVSIRAVFRVRADSALLSPLIFAFNGGLFSDSTSK